MDDGQVFDRYQRAIEDRDDRLRKFTELEAAFPPENMSLITGGEHIVYGWRLALVASASVRSIFFQTRLGAAVTEAWQREKVAFLTREHPQSEDKTL